MEKNTPATQPINDNSPDNGADPGAVFSDPLDGITSTILANAPRVSPGFVKKMGAEEITTRETHAAAQVSAGDPSPTPDKSGKYYNPRYCVTSKDGAPRLTRAGLWEMKKDKKTGGRFPRSVLKNNPPRTKQPSTEPAELKHGEPAQVIENTNEPRRTAEPAALNMPPDMQDQPLNTDEPTAADSGAAPGYNPQREKAAALAMMCDASFFNIMHFLGDSTVIDAVRKNTSAPGVAALTDGFASMDNIPDPPWYLMAALIYTPAAIAIVTHEKSSPKRLGAKVWIGKAWLKMTGLFRKKKKMHEPAAEVQPEPERQDIF